MRTALLVAAALLMIAVGALVYIRYFVTPLDKHGMVYRETEQTETIEQGEERTS